MTTETTEQRRARRAAERAARDAELDLLAEKARQQEQTRQRALANLDRLPGEVGPAVLALFEALEPVRMDDGYLSYPVVGTSADVISGLAAAIAEVSP